MAIYIMNSKTLLDDFIKQKPKRVLKSQYVIVSQSIKRKGKYKNIIVGNHLYPDVDYVIGYMETQNYDAFKESYFEQIKVFDPFFATLIKGAIEENFTIVFLCSKDEWKSFDYLKLISTYVKKRFNYPIYNYGKDDEKKSYDKKDVLKKCNNILKKASTKQKNEKLKTIRGRKELLSDMSKKDMKKELKSYNLYYEGMSKKDMKDALEAFFVGE